MPTDLQIISPTEAIRKAFGVRGAFGMQVDETISPTVMMRQLDQAPYRQDGLELIIGQSQAAVVGQFQGIQFTYANVLGETDLFVCDRILLTNSTAAIQNIRIALSLGLLAASRTARSTEQLPVGSNITDYLQSTLLSSCPYSAAGAIAATTLTDVFVGVNGFVDVPLGGLVLRQGLSVNAESTGTNQGVNATLTGRLYRGV